MSKAKTKVCSECGEAKPLAEFHKMAVSPDGLRPNCKACGLAYAKEHYRKSHTLRPSRRAHNGIKRCCTCHRSKPVAEFHKHAKSPDGLQYRCKSCEAATGRRHQLKQRFGLTEADWQRMFAEQGGVCKICGEPETVKQQGKRRSLAVDHCHATGRVRGLLCQQCNRALGGFCDDRGILQKAIDYLSQPGELAN